ncbi:MAG TPA: cellulase family glycosylhydrolase [Ktedonobacterales bacterium]|nr:cellulase family glycosylhydrolase [Ktedonobacterales bacterium]
MFTPKARLLISRLAALLAIVVTLGILGFSLQLGGINQQPSTGQRQPLPSIPAQPFPSVTPLPRQFEALSIAGNQIVDAEGQAVTLVGVNRSSLEYLCSGDGHFQLADFLAMRSWGMNIVRISLSSEFWANADNRCPGYRQTVRAAIANAEQAGLYVILDLQWNAPFNLPDDSKYGGGQYPLPDSAKDLAFWQDIARLYRSDPAVLFDLFGEPHDISWDAWYNGGPLDTQLYQGNHPAGGDETYEAIGMPALAAKVRAIAPENLILISGPNWGFDLSEISTHPIQLPNLLYSTHPFDYGGKEPGDWPTAFGSLTQHQAVIAAEFGSYSCQTDYIATAIAYFEAHHMSWLAWGWTPGPCGAPSLLKDWAGTPISPYGDYIRQQMLAAARAGLVKTPGPSGICVGEPRAQIQGCPVPEATDPHTR